MPVEGAVVRLLDRDGSERDAGFSGEEGEFVLEADSAGSYRVEVERIGFETWRSPAFSLGEDGSLDRTFRIGIRPIRLEEVVARGRGKKCTPNPREGRTTALLWTEIRKALERERRTRDDPEIRFRLRRYERILDHRLQLEKEDARTLVAEAETPYRSAPAEKLASLGFVVREFDDLYYRAPDADVVLSNVFQQTHCFGIERRDDRVGLTFRPIGRRLLPDVRGVLWVDRSSARLEKLVFDYVNLHFTQPVPKGSAGGEVEFEELPDGRWIVRRWWIRWPHTVIEERDASEVARRAIRRSGEVNTEPERRVARYQEVGGEVLETLVEDGATVPSRQIVQRGRVVGAVYDSLRGTPLQGAEIRLEGTGRVTRSDLSGQFSFDGVPGGRYRVTWRHPAVSWLGDVTEAAEVHVQGGWMAEATLTTPGPERMRRLLCRSDAGTTGEGGVGSGDPGGGVILGRVVEAGSGEPMRGTQVRFSLGDGPTDVPEALAGALREVRGPRAVATDNAGGFVVCGLPTGREVTLEVEGTRRSTRLSAERPLAVEEFEVSAPTPARRAAVGEDRGSALLGYVRSGAGRRPLAGAFVRLHPGDRMMSAREHGLFRFEDVDPGSHRVSVDHPGYVADSVRVEVSPEAVTLVRVEVSADSAADPGIRVVSRRTVREPWLRSYYGRLADGTGRFVAGVRVERRGWVEALSEVPGVTLRACETFEGREIPDCHRLAVELGPATEPECEAEIWVDGERIAPREGEAETRFSDLREIAPEEVEGVEVHDPSTVPSRYAEGAEACGTVLGWTRP